VFLLKKIALFYCFTFKKSASILASKKNRGAATLGGVGAATLGGGKRDSSSFGKAS